MEDMRPRPYVAKVNGEKIYWKDLQDRMAIELNIPKESEDLKNKKLQSLREEILEQLIHEAVMLKRAGELGLKIGDEELDKKIDDIKKEYSAERFNRLFTPDKIHYGFWKEAQRRRLLLEKLVAMDVNSRLSVSDEEVEAYIASRENEGDMKKHVHVLQILLDSKEHAEGVLKRLKGGEDFGKVASQESISPEAARGGDMGYFTPGVMPEAIDKAVFSLSTGEISGIVKSPYGYHIFKVIGKNGGGAGPHPDTKERLRTDLRRQKEAFEYRRWLKGLREKAAVKINEDVLNPESKR
jgi:parvulin-like peptidyl-prolyl isomerase